ncbi:MAG: class I adenylate-forming enzyme family protein [Syntrophorhabdus sp.]
MYESVSPSSGITNIRDLLFFSSAAFPERIALVSPEIALTYAQLGSLVVRTASYLLGYALGRGSRIAIIGDNHPAYIIGYLGAQAGGMSTVEMGKYESIDRIETIIEQTESKFVITDRQDVVEALNNKVRALLFDEFIREIESKEETNGVRKINIAPDDEASIVFTSGTTSFPKGVVLTQANFCFIAEVVSKYLGLSPDDRYALILPMSHTYGKSIVLSTLKAGASVIMLNNFTDIQNFLKALADLKCTILSAVPYNAHVLLKWGNLSKHDLSSLKKMTFSGNKLPASTIDKLLEKLPGVEIYSMYGLTESTTRVCYLPPEHLLEKKESCGKPLPGVDVRILNEKGDAMPSGKVGQVFVKGPNVMRCYFQDPELTAQTIVDGWLNTGDLGRLDEDGFLFLEGREKEIIKCAGERISPLEIEEVILNHPHVSEVSVIGTADPTLGEIVHAFVVPKSESLVLSELRTYCAKHLSHHKIPRKYTIARELPKTATGKVKKHLLREEKYSNG